MAEEPIPARLRIANLATPHRMRISHWWTNAAAAALLLALGGASGWVGRGAVPGPGAPAEPMTQAAVSAFRTYVVEAAHPVEVRADGSSDLVQWHRATGAACHRAGPADAGFPADGRSACSRRRRAGGHADVR